MSNISFAGLYSRFQDKWYDFSKDGKEVTKNEILTDYNLSRKKQALYLNSKDLLVNVGDIWWQTRADNHPIFVTGKEAKEFNEAKRAQESIINKKPNAIKDLFNKWYKDLYIFNDINVKKMPKEDRIDILG